MSRLRAPTVRHLLRTALQACALSLVACTEETPPAPPPPKPSTDIDRLSQLINLPERPESVVFVRVTMGDGFLGPSDSFLTAVLHYDHSALERLTQHAERLRPEERSIPLGDRYAWFPESVANAMKPCPAPQLPYKTNPEIGPLLCIDGAVYSGEAFRKGGFVTASFIVPDGQDLVIFHAGT
jgi:hypothetical protein